MPRLFIGLEIPPLQRAALALSQSGLPDTRWIEPSDLHITLRFIGDVSPKEADAIVEALDSRDWTAPHIVFNGLAVFGKSKPRSLYASVAEDEALMRLAASLERLMQRLGLPANAQKFAPHVTLARFRGGVQPEAVAGYLNKSGPLAVPAFTPERFILYSAKESTGGGPYIAEEAFTFSGRAMTNPILTSEEVETALDGLVGWTKMEGRTAISRSYKFATFTDAMAFMANAVPVIEKLDHHPRWTNNYNRVDVELTTHNNSAGHSGITRLDVELATALDRLAEH